MWACGVIAYLLLADKFPFDGKDKAEVENRVRQGSYSLSGSRWARISNSAKSFIKYCLTVDEDKRPNAEKALQHPWIRDARETVADNFHKTEVCTAAETFDNLKNFQARR